MQDATLSSADSAVLVEMEQECDGIVAMTFDLLHAAGYIGEESRSGAVEAFITSLEVECELAARWGDRALGVLPAW